MARLALMAAAVVLAFLAAVPVTEVAAKRWIVGDNKFWNPNINYTIWAQDKHFYLDDWLYFVYERNQYNVIEVNETNYISCNADNPIANWSRGSGRDVVHLNVTRHYYLISGSGGGCYGGMKLDVLVEKPPPHQPQHLSRTMQDEPSPTWFCTSVCHSSSCFTMMGQCGTRYCGFV
ncbi:hypothetical protein HID58_094136, partial [Brassica napus]